MRKEILKRLIALRKNAGIQSNVLSAKLGQCEHYCSRVERGKYLPSLGIMEQWATICGSNLEQLFCKEFNKYEFDRKIVEYFRQMGKIHQDSILAMMVLYAENKLEKEEEKNETKNETDTGVI